jgi:hypothetical protein
MPKAAGAAKVAGAGPDAGGWDTGNGEATGAEDAGAGEAETGAPKLGGIMPGLFAASGCFPAC